MLGRVESAQEAGCWVEWGWHRKRAAGQSGVGSGSVLLEMAGKKGGTPLTSAQMKPRSKSEWIAPAACTRRGKRRHQGQR